VEVALGTWCVDRIARSENTPGEQDDTAQAVANYASDIRPWLRYNLPRKDAKLSKGYNAKIALQ
jgi:hypothetical protein